MDKNRKVFIVLNIIILVLCIAWLVLGYLRQSKLTFLVGAGVTGLIVFMFFTINIFHKNRYFSLNMTYTSSIFLLLYIINYLYFGNKIFSLITILLFAIILIPTQIGNLFFLQKRMNEQQKVE